MREIVKLSLTLAVVGLVSAALLTWVNNVTAPIILERQEAEYRQALEGFFPDFDRFETEIIEEDYFDLIFNSAGEMIGIMSTIWVQGYEGRITYNLALDGAGEIIGLQVISHSETPGIGDVITTDDFLDQFIGKSFEDPITAGEDVDAITGATISTVAIIDSVRRVVAVVAENFLGQEVGAINVSEIPDGIYQGAAPGWGGPITVEVEIAGSRITRIDVLEHNEYPTYFIEAYPLIAERVIAEQSFDIDTKTGATLSARGIVEAGEAALVAALEANGGGE